MTQLAKVDSFGLVLPDRWTPVPTDVREFDAFCERARQKWRQAPEWDRALERRADTVLARLRHELAKAGVVLAAVYIEQVVDDDSAERSPELLVAAGTLGVYTKADLDTALSLSVPVLFSAFARRPRDDEQRFGRITDIVRPDVTELPAGRSVHLRRLYEPRHVGTQLDDYFAESFVVPVGTDGEACCVLQFATTNVSHAQQFSELFGGIARTFRFFEPDEPTTFDAP